MKVGDFVKEHRLSGIILTCGPRSFDVIWIGGSTSRYRHGTREVVVVPAEAMDRFEQDQLTKELHAARDERRRGAGVRRAGGPG